MVHLSMLAFRVFLVLFWKKVGKKNIHTIIYVITQWAKSPFLTIWHCILSAGLTKTHSFRPFFGNFAHWECIKLSLLFFKFMFWWKYIFCKCKKLLEREIIKTLLHLALFILSAVFVFVFKISGLKKIFECIYNITWKLFKFIYYIYLRDKIYIKNCSYKIITTVFFYSLWHLLNYKIFELQKKKKKTFVNIQNRIYYL